MPERSHKEFFEACEANPTVESLRLVSENMVHVYRDGKQIASDEDIQTVNDLCDKYVEDYFAHKGGRIWWP